MRPVLIGDVIAAARVLAPLPRGQRAGALRALLARADLADRHRKRLGRAHPRWGNGSLMAAAHAEAPPPEPFLDDPAYLEALICVLWALRARRLRHLRAHKKPKHALSP